MQVAIEDNGVLARYVSLIDHGEDVILTKGGEPVARIVAAAACQQGEQQTAAERLIAMYEKGYELKGLTSTRDELYDRAG